MPGGLCDWSASLGISGEKAEAQGDKESADEDGNEKDDEGFHDI